MFLDTIQFAFELKHAISSSIESHEIDFCGDFRDYKVVNEQECARNFVELLAKHNLISKDEANALNKRL